MILWLRIVATKRSGYVFYVAAASLKRETLVSVVRLTSAVYAAHIAVSADAEWTNRSVRVRYCSHYQ